MEVVNGQVEYEFECPKNKTKDRIRVEKALLSIGRVPNLEGLGLEKVGVKMVDKHKIFCKDVNSSVDNIWVIGDTTMDLALVNVAEIGKFDEEEHEGENKHQRRKKNEKKSEGGVSSLSFFSFRFLIFSLNYQRVVIV
jgi:pyruvate/2-oxoglutarate dehydrogenase complex dihydrolipoamide dehydrogenase (E3) component